MHAPDSDSANPHSDIRRSELAKVNPRNWCLREWALRGCDALVEADFRPALAAGFAALKGSSKSRADADESAERDIIDEAGEEIFSRQRPAELDAGRQTHGLKRAQTGLPSAPHNRAIEVVPEDSYRFAESSPGALMRTLTIHLLPAPRLPLGRSARPLPHNLTTSTCRCRRSRWPDGRKVRSYFPGLGISSGQITTDRLSRSVISIRGCASSGRSTMTRRPGLSPRRRRSIRLRALLVGRRPDPRPQLQHADDGQGAGPGRLGRGAARRAAAAKARRSSGR